MSAFLVTRRVILDSVRAMLTDDEVRTAMMQRHPDDYEPDAATDIDGPTKLARDLCRLNADAVNARYGSRETGPTVADYYYGGRTIMPESLAERVQLYKSLECLIYQCSEGDIPEKSPLYLRMVKGRDRFAREIVCGLPEYDKAQWNRSNS